MMGRLTSLKHQSNFTNRFFTLAITILVAFLFVKCEKRGLSEGEGYVDVTGGKVWYKIVQVLPRLFFSYMVVLVSRVAT